MKSKHQQEEFHTFHSVPRMHEVGKYNNNHKLNEQDIFSQSLRQQPFSVLNQKNQLSKVRSSRIPETKQPQKNRRFQINSNTTKPFVLKRTIYAIALLALMTVVCLYFEYLSNYNFLSLILGVVACVVFQVKVLQYIFKKDMYKMQIDEYGALRAKIKYHFGQLNTNYLDQKNRKKYYHHNLNVEDKIFDKQNQDIYNNTMQYLISKSKINHIENIQKIHRKWQIILAKYDIMKKFVNSFMDLHGARTKIFNNFIEKINSTFSENDYQMLERITKNSETQKDEERKVPGFYKLLGNKLNSVVETQKSKSQIRQNDFTDLSFSEDGFSMSENNTMMSVELKNELSDLKKQSHKSSGQENKNNNLLKWKEIINILQYRHRINVKKQAYMKQSVLDQLRLTSDEAKSQRQSSIKGIQNLREKYEQNIKTKLQIHNQIQKLKLKIDQLSSIILTKKRTTENNQEICKMQLDIRIKKVQIENLQVKQALLEDLIKRTSYELYIKCRDINKQLQTRTLPQFNNKLSNYINMLLEYEKRCSKYIFNLIKESQSFKIAQKGQNENANILFDPVGLLRQENFQRLDQLINSQSFSQIYDIYIIRQRSQKNIKVFFDQTKRFYREMNLNLEKTIQTIEIYQKQLFEKANGEGINQNGRNTNFSTHKDKQNQLDSLPSLTTNYTTNLFYDRYFLNVLASLSRKDEKVLNNCMKILEKQSQLINQYQQTYCRSSANTVQNILEKYTKLEQQLKKIQKSKSKTLNPDEFSMNLKQHEGRVQSIKNQLYAEIKKKDNVTVLSMIPELTRQLIEKHLKIHEYILIHQKKSFHFEAPTEKQEQEQNRNIRFKQYQLYVLKVQKNNFDDPLYESLSRSNENRNQGKKKPLINDTLFKTNLMTLKQETNLGKTDTVTKEKHLESKEESLKMLNRLLGVLFEEWSNSQFFHDLIKEELETSLNFKRPGIVEPLRISHFKVQEKTKQSGFEDLVPHGSQMYRCIFDVKINFKGKIAVHITSRLNFGNRTLLNIQLLIKEFRCPLRICFNPFSIAKSYVSLLQRPHLNIQYDVKIGQWHINRIPFFSQILQIFIVLKLRKKMLWPKRITLSIPLAYKNTLGIAIRQRILFQNQKRKQKMN